VDGILVAIGFFAYAPSYCAHAHLAIEEYIASSLSAALLL
jgi:hypothetical protein